MILLICLVGKSEKSSCLDPVLDVYKTREIDKYNQFKNSAIQRIQGTSVYRPRDFLDLLPRIEATPETQYSYDSSGNLQQRTGVQYSVSVDVFRVFSIAEKKRMREIQKLRSLKRVTNLHSNILIQLELKYRYQDQIEKLKKIKESIRDTEKIIQLDEKIEDYNFKALKAQSEIDSEAYGIENEVLICIQ